MTPREELDTEPIEPDPTGMRALLSSLPDPGPMPEDLEAQILARLADLRAEDAGREEITGLPHPPARDREADIVPLTAYGKDRPDRHRWFAAAAGIAAAAVLGLVVTDGLKGDGWITSIGGNADSAASSSSAESAEAPARSDGQPDAASDAVGRRVGTGTDYTAATLPDQASSLLALERNASGVDPKSQPDTVSPCLAALDITAQDRPIVDIATYEGRAALVIVWTRDGRSSVVVTEPTCGPDGTNTLAGPTQLD